MKSSRLLIIFVNFIFVYFWWHYRILISKIYHPLILIAFQRYSLSVSSPEFLQWQRWPRYLPAFGTDPIHAPESTTTYRSLLYTLSAVPHLEPRIKLNERVFKRLDWMKFREPSNYERKDWPNWFVRVVRKLNMLNSRKQYFKVYLVCFQNLFENIEN